MKEYKAPYFESIYFDVDERIMKGELPNEGETGENPWPDDFVSGGETFNGLSFKA